MMSLKRSKPNRCNTTAQLLRLIPAHTHRPGTAPLAGLRRGLA